ncbi:uncharacterized protein EI97DRAFT_441983 [Westerdykella ornata]|uniref:Uncharacterized protein n=1 Tax=Westerdykella ornata TaxID=318751 RepID=A0A6A6JNK9_WESOR|nr:uncharacterized protein EI97DRAFT_441983 [Westerdykella ornata]KAF2277246.1 hypothetical protein EI97DRAFT_441983 [Westerdykella ornata]
MTGRSRQNSAGSQGRRRSSRLSNRSLASLNFDNMPPLNGEWIAEEGGLDPFGDLDTSFGFINEGTSMADGSGQNPAEGVSGDGYGWSHPIDNFIEQRDFAQVSDGPTAIPMDFPVDGLQNVSTGAYPHNPLLELDDSWGFLPENPELVSLPTTQGYEGAVAQEASQQLTNAYQNDAQTGYGYDQYPSQPYSYQPQTTVAVPSTPQPYFYRPQTTSAAPNTGGFEYPPPNVSDEPYYVNPDLTYTAAPTQDQDSLFYPEASTSTDRRRVSASSAADRRKRSDLSTYSLANTTDTEELHELRRTRKVRKTGPAQRVQYKPEKPKLRADKPWVRKNNTTKGLTSRTGKINNYRPIYYENRPHPIGGPWKTPNGYKFKYTKNWEFSQATYSAAQLNDFIFHYPRDKNKHSKLTIWIQKSSTDSAVRYASATHKKCRFRDCPANLYGNGTITVGQPRVAFDERWHEHGMNVDPYLVAGYAHLYCMERFLDFEAICKLGIVKVDERVFRKEPNGRFAATLNGEAEADIAVAFIQAAMEGTLRTDRKLKQFRNYPVHSEYRHGEPKPHDDTLTFWMMQELDEARPPSQVFTFWDRGLRGTVGIVNKGNVELQYFDKIKKKNAARKVKAMGNRKKKAAASLWDDDDEELEQAQEEELRDKMEKAIAYCFKKLKDHPKFNPNPEWMNKDQPGSETSKGKRKAFETDEDDEEPDEPQPGPQTSKCKRKVFEIDEDGEEPDEPQPEPKTSKRKRKVFEIDDDDEESDEPQEYGSDDDDDDDHEPGPKVRGSRQSSRLRNKTRKVNYAIASPAEVPQNVEEPAPKRQRCEPTQQELSAQNPLVQDPGYFDDVSQYAPYSDGLGGFQLDASDLDFGLTDELSQYLTRRRSTLYAARHRSRGASVLKSAMSSPKIPDRRKVSIGGVTTHLFDTSASPLHAIRRPSSQPRCICPEVRDELS